MKFRLCAITIAILPMMAACTAKDETAPTPDEAEAIQTAPDYKQLSEVLQAPWRTDEMKARDQYRHPAKTLEFCGVDPAGNVSEIWPGSGWYSAILKPWIVANGGTFNAVVLDPATSERSADLLKRYLEEFSDPDDGSHFTHSVMSATSGGFAPPDSQDAVLTFRNVHSWMARGWAEKAFQDFYSALKPGGTLCVVEHRLPSSSVQDPKAPSGYVQEAMVKALAKEAGFDFVAASSINANPRDNADHPYGVWALQPVRRSPTTEEDKAKYPDFDRAALDAIGESDRMTLKFVKPAATQPAEPESQAGE